MRSDASRRVLTHRITSYFMNNSPRRPSNGSTGDIHTRVALTRVRAIMRALFAQTWRAT